MVIYKPKIRQKLEVLRQYFQFCLEESLCKVVFCILPAVVGDNCKFQHTTTKCFVKQEFRKFYLRIIGILKCFSSPRTNSGCTEKVKLIFKCKVF